MKPIPLFCSIDPVVFTIINGKLHVLLFKRNSLNNNPNEPFPDYLALPGGAINVNIDDSLDLALSRILSEKTGATVNYFEQLESFGGFRDTRGWTLSISYIALISPQKLKSTANWIPIKEAQDLILAFDHNIILNKAIQRLSNKVNYSTLPIHLLGDEFTLPQLQKVYEIILNETLDKSSFRKKIEESNLIEPSGNELKNGAFRPSKLYKLKKPGIIHNFGKNII